MRIELNSFCEVRHDYILSSMPSVVKREAFDNLSGQFYDLASLMQDNELTWNLDLVCALNLLAIHRVLDIVKQSDSACVYGKNELNIELEKIITELKSSKYLSFSEFKEFSDRRNVEQLLNDINATENNTGLRMLCNGDIVVFNN